MFTPEQMYQPRVDAFLKVLPPLYAFRMVALELGGVSLAQGSPSEGPPAHIIMNAAIAMLDWAVKQSPAMGPSAIDPQSIALAHQFLSQHSTLAGTPNLSIELTGYPDVRNYKAVQQAAADFLARGFKTDITTIGSPENHIIIDNYSRHLLNMSLEALYRTNEDRTVRENKNRNIVLTYNGHWPLVTDLVQAKGYTLIHLSPSDPNAFKFEDFLPTIVSQSDDTNFVIYVNNPNNPLSVMYAQEQQETFLLKTAKFNRLQEEAGIARRVRVLSDNAYWGWVNPQYIKESGFPFFTKAASVAASKTHLPVQDWLIECFSLGKVFGLASMGASFAFVGDTDLHAKILRNQTRDTNTPGIDKLGIILQTLTNVDFDHLLYRAAAINKNLITTRETLKSAQHDLNLPINIAVDPQHGAYISVELGAELLNRRVFIRNQPYDVKSIMDICKFLVEKYGVAITPNDQTDLPGTVRIFVDTSEKALQDGTKRIITGLTELLDAERPPQPFSAPILTQDM